MWAFVLFESLLFTSYFAVYLFNRARNEDLYLQSQSHLELWVGVFNTIVLLTSSWSIARCVQAARAGSYRAALTNASLTAGFGLVFLVLKVVEWVRQFRMGNTFTTNDFFMHYFFLTGMHLLHLLIGFVVLGVIVYQLRGPARRSQRPGRDLRHLLAHGRLPVGAHLRDALRGEVIEIRHTTAHRLGRAVRADPGYLWLDHSADGRGGLRASAVVTTAAIVHRSGQGAHHLSRVHGGPARAGAAVPAHRRLDRDHGRQPARQLLRRRRPALNPISSAAAGAGGNRWFAPHTRRMPVLGSGACSSPAAPYR